MHTKGQYRQFRDKISTKLTEQLCLDWTRVNYFSLKYMEMESFMECKIFQDIMDGRRTWNMGGTRLIQGHFSEIPCVNINRRQSIWGGEGVSPPSWIHQ